MDRTESALTLSGWIRHLWTGLLFAGPSSATEGWPRPAFLAVLLILPALLLYPYLGFHLFEPDESRYAQIPREMLERGDWLVPTLQSEPYLDKPPLFYWLVMLSYSVFGYEVWAARLIPALALHGCILMTYLFGRRVLGDWPALLGALVLSLAPGFLVVSRLLLLDGLLTFLVCLSLFAAFEAIRGTTLHRGWWLVAAVACGLGVLTKGPVAVLLLVPPLWLYRTLSGQGIWPGRMAWLAFFAVVLAIALPWYVAMCWRIPEFLGYFFWEHNLQRFLTPAMHVRGVWFFLPIVFLFLLPGSLLIWPLGRFLLDRQRLPARSPELSFHVLVGGWIVLFFTLSTCKLPTYILPALPSLALVIGVFMKHTDWYRARLTRWTAAVAGLLIVLANGVAIPWYAEYRSPMSRPTEVLALCADPSASVVCYPRNCDSVAFYLGRRDLRVFPSKNIEDLRTLVRKQPRTVILCTHRHSLQGLKQLLPPEVHIVHEVRMGLQDIPGVPQWLMRPLKKVMGETALGLGDLAVVEFPPLCRASTEAAKPTDR
jgi:4-amino-4-deoxy-L-arabinose transferase-like glycosyltransferase